MLIERLQQQIISYKKQIEEAEEIAALNLSSFHRYCQKLDNIVLAENSAKKLSLA